MPIFPLRRRVGDASTSACHHHRNAARRAGREPWGDDGEWWWVVAVAVAQRVVESGATPVPASRSLCELRPRATCCGCACSQRTAPFFPDSSIECFGRLSLWLPAPTRPTRPWLSSTARPAKYSLSFPPWRARARTWRRRRSPNGVMLFQRSATLASSALFATRNSMAMAMFSDAARCGAVERLRPSSVVWRDVLDCVLASWEWCGWHGSWGVATFQSHLRFYR